MGSLYDDGPKTKAHLPSKMKFLFLLFIFYFWFNFLLPQKSKEIIRQESFSQNRFCWYSFKILSSKILYWKFQKKGKKKKKHPKMRTPCCHTFLAFVLKFLNFLQTFIGISIIIYSAYMLNQWQHHTPPPAPMPYDPEFKLPGNTIPALNSISDVVFGVGDNGIRLNSHIILAPWYFIKFCFSDIEFVY